MFFIIIPFWRLFYYIYKIVQEIACQFREIITVRLFNLHKTCDYGIEKLQSNGISTLIYIAKTKTNPMNHHRVCQQTIIYVILKYFNASAMAFSFSFGQLGTRWPSLPLL